MMTDVTTRTTTTISGLQKSARSRDSVNEFKGTVPYSYHGPVFLFDCQHLLIEYKPENLLLQGMDRDEVDDFMANVFNEEWMDLLLRGEQWYDLSKIAIDHYPEHRDTILMFQNLFTQTVNDQYPYMVNFVAKLRKRGYPCYLVCDMHGDMFEQLSPFYDVLNNFYGRFLSGDVGQRIMDELLNTACQALAIPNNRAIFITGNIFGKEHAETLGLKSIFFETESQFENDLTALNINMKTL